MKVSDLLMVDLGCGLGGASQPFRDRGWTVVTVDRDPRVHPDVVADVRGLLTLPARIDFLWASMDCTEFSRFGMRCFFKAPPDPDLSSVLAVRRIIDEHQECAWAVENVRASRNWLDPIFGQPAAISSGHVIWSSIALFPQLRKRAKENTGSDGRWDRSLKRAIIPYEVGAGIASIIESHRE